MKQQEVIKNTVHLIDKIKENQIGDSERLDSIKNYLEILGSLYQGDKFYLQQLRSKMS